MNITDTTLMDKENSVNRLLVKWREGDQAAYNELFTILHSDLSTIAHRLFKRERVDHTLQTGDLISKFYIKMLGSKTIPWDDYTHFLRASARTMRQLLIDHSRGWERRATGKNGQPLPEPDAKDKVLVDSGKDEGMFRMVQLSEALEKMADYDKNMAQIADLRLVVGLTLDEISNCLDLPINKVKREWLMIKKLLADVL